ncbi:MAG: site-2 protease family protein [Candidatus Omnitrophota bacterium]
MKNSIKLFDVLGISIRIHLTFLLMPLIFSYFYGLKGVFLIFFVFMCVTLHELSHSLQARRFGIKVEEIILLPIGGIAEMKSIPEKPAEEFRVSIAGPLFNITLALVLFVPAYYYLGLKYQTLLHPGIGTWPQTFAYAFWINPILAGFNLLPAFPMDGGRILRAFLAKRMDYGRATRIAVGFGHTFAVLFGFVGLFSTPANPILIIIAFFIFMAASSEGMQVDLRLTLRKFLVKDVLPAEFLTVNTSMPLADILALSLHSHQEDFPVVEEEKLVGLLTRNDIIGAIHHFGVTKQAKDVMRVDFPTVTTRTPLMKVHSLMEEWQIKAMPVLTRKKVAGIITLEDISRVYMLMSAKR